MLALSTFDTFWLLWADNVHTKGELSGNFPVPLRKENAIAMQY